tara:strand:+ start:1069 stop:4278 length:3210 start_codon:yes stop_codon:yes gene_type:complete
MNGVDRTKFNRAAAAPYKERKVIWHGQPGSFRDDAQGNLVWTPDSGADLGSNGIEDITDKLVETGQAGGMQYQYDPATGGVTHRGGVLSLAPPPPPPSPGAVQEPSGPGQQGQPPGPSFPSEEAKSQSAMFSAAFGSSQGDPNFNVNFDYNQDGIINYDDQLQFGQSFAPPPPADSPTQEIDDSIQSMVATAGDQRTAWGQPYSPEYYSRYQDGYRTYLEGLGEKARANALKAPHKTYRNYVIDQLEVTPELGNVLRGAWEDEDVQAIARSIVSGEGILSLDHINSIPEELLSGSRKSHIEKVVNEAATRVSSRDAANLPFDLRMKRSNYLLDQAERDGLVSRSDREAFNQHVGTLSTAEQTAAVDNPLVAISQYLNRPLSKPAQPPLAAGDPPGEVTDQEVGEGDVGSLQDPFREVIGSIATQMGFEDYDPATGEPYLRTSLADQGYTPEQVERIIQEARKEATEGIAAGDTIFNQMQSGTFDEDATRAQLLQEGYTPNEVSALIANATTRLEEAEYGVLQDEFSEWLSTQLPLLAQSGDGDTYTKTLMQWKNRGLSEEDIQAAQQAWSQQGGDSNWQARQGPGVDEGIPPGWVDADNDGFDDNTDLDIDGTPRVFTQEDPEQFEATATKPVMPDTDDTINDIVTYLRDASETQDGIDNIAADDLNQLSTEAERAQEQLLEDLNRLGLVGLESGDAQAAIGEFKGKVLAEQSRIRRESDERIRENIDRLIEVAGLEVSKTESEFRIKELEQSIKSADQRALFQGVMNMLGPDGFNLVGGLFGGDGQPGAGAGPGTGTPSWGQDIYNVPQTLRNIPGLKDADFSNVYNDDGTVVENMFQYKNAAGDIVRIPKDFNIATDPGAIQLRAQGFTDKEILNQMAATKPPKWFDPSKMKQAAGFLAAGEVAGEVLPGALGSIAKGASQGAAIGSVVPVIGTGIGAAIGAGISGISAALGIGMSGHNDRQIESSWHPAILDVLFQKGFTPRDKVSKPILDEIAQRLNIPYEGKNSLAFRRSSHYEGVDVEKQDKLWAKQYKEGKLSREDFITMSLASSVGNSGIDLNKWGRNRRA